MAKQEAFIQSQLLIFKRFLTGLQRWSAARVPVQVAAADSHHHQGHRGHRHHRLPEREGGQGNQSTGIYKLVENLYLAIFLGSSGPHFKNEEDYDEVRPVYALRLINGSESSYK